MSVGVERGTRGWEQTQSVN